jgi:hypothetical protein
MASTCSPSRLPMCLLLLLSGCGVHEDVTTAIFIVDNTGKIALDYSGLGICTESLSTSEKPTRIEWQAKSVDGEFKVQITGTSSKPTVGSIKLKLLVEGNWSCKLVIVGVSNIQVKQDGKDMDDIVVVLEPGSHEVIITGTY